MKGAFSEFLEVSKNSSGVLECSQLMVEITSFVEEAEMKCVLVWYYRYEPHSESSDGRICLGRGFQLEFLLTDG